MGLFDYFGEEGIQLKAGECQMFDYHVGEDVPLADGVYVAYEGLVVVKSGKLLMTFPEGFLYNKWGGELYEQGILDADNPIVQTIQNLRGLE